MQWAKKGGGVMFAMTPEKTGYLDVIGPQIGIESSAYEFFGDEIDTIREFHASDQRTYGKDISTVWAIAMLLKAVGYSGDVSIEMKRTDVETVRKTLAYIAEVFA